VASYSAENIYTLFSECSSKGFPYFTKDFLHPFTQYLFKTNEKFASFNDFMQSPGAQLQFSSFFVAFNQWEDLPSENDTGHTDSKARLQQVLDSLVNKPANIAQVVEKTMRFQPGDVTSVEGRAHEIKVIGNQENAGLDPIENSIVERRLKSLKKQSKITSSSIYVLLQRCYGGGRKWFNQDLLFDIGTILSTTDETLTFDSLRNVDGFERLTNFFTGYDNLPDDIKDGDSLRPSYMKIKIKRTIEHMLINAQKVQSILKDLEKIEELEGSGKAEANEEISNTIIPMSILLVSAVSIAAVAAWWNGLLVPSSQAKNTSSDNSAQVENSDNQKAISIETKEQTEPNTEKVLIEEVKQDPKIEEVPVELSTTEEVKEEPKAKEVALEEKKQELKMKETPMEKTVVEEVKEEPKTKQTATKEEKEKSETEELIVENIEKAPKKKESARARKTRLRKEARERAAKKSAEKDINSDSNN
jgi:chemotaxis protein histidine kinase CheA